jgi:hypothetical protein
MAESQILIRLQRAKATLRETRDARGWTAAFKLVGRTLLKKGPMLFRQLGAGKKTTQLRNDIAKGRAELGSNEPYLAFVLTGGLGDYVVIARFIRDVVEHVGQLRFDVFSPNPVLANWAFAEIAGFNCAYYDMLFEHIKPEYDLCLRVNQFVLVYQEHVRWRSIRNNQALMHIIERLHHSRPKIEMFVERHPLMDNFLARAAVFGDATRQNFLHRMAGLRYGGDRLNLRQNTDVVRQKGLRPFQYVTVHNGFDTGFVITGRRATKCYPHFGTVVTQLKAARPDLQFVQIGSVTSQAIEECDQVLLNQTSLDEVVGLIAQAALHLDNEGGLVHVAASVGTRSTVVFGPTPSDYFGYPGNINIEPPVCGNCWWMTRTWMDVCAKGYDTPRCMTEQPPEIVARHALQAMAQTVAKPNETRIDPAMRASRPDLAQVASG